MCRVTRQNDAHLDVFSTGVCPKVTDRHNQFIGYIDYTKRKRLCLTGAGVKGLLFKYCEKNWRSRMFDSSFYISYWKTRLTIILFEKTTDFTKQNKNVSKNQVFQCYTRIRRNWKLNFYIHYNWYCKRILVYSSILWVNSVSRLGFRQGTPIDHENSEWSVNA